MGCCEKKRNQLIDKEKAQEIGEILYPKLNYNDFEPLKLLGTGTFGRVLLVRFKSNNQLYAMKILMKSRIKSTHQEEHTKAERDLMVQIDNPFLLNIKFAFQDETKLYIVSNFMQGGDMFYHLHFESKFSEKKAKFYLIEIILGLEYLHKNNMIYRDLKPENILMDSTGHIKLSDFGLSKILSDNDEKAFTLCGTPQYLAPEIMKEEGYDKNVDWWSLGCFFYEMITGFLPFYIPKDYLNEKVYEQKVIFPSGINPLAIKFIKELLVVDPNNRLGNGVNGVENIKSHEYFKDVDWNKYYNKEIEPPFIPKLDSDEDLKYFDKMFTDEPVDSPVPQSRPRVYSTYKGFTYVNNSIKKDMDDKNKTNSDENIEIKEDVAQDDI